MLRSVLLPPSASAPSVVSHQAPRPDGSCSVARLRSVSVAQAKPPKATESRRGWARAPLRARAGWWLRDVGYIVGRA